MNNTEEIIQESIEDAELPAEPVVEETAEVEAAPEVAETDDAISVASPGAKAQPVEEEDEFTKRFGIPAVSPSGRENRIPHSRVRNMIAKAEKELTARLGGDHTKLLSERDAKIQAYEEQLTQIGAFENTLMNKPDEFLQWLSAVPAYKPFFDWVQQASQQAQAAPGATNVADPMGDMPGPNVTLPDGSRQYDDVGIKALLDWNTQRTLKEAQDYFGKEFAPIKQDWETQQYMAKVVPQVEKKLNEARQWHLFSENEAEITKVFQANPTWTIEQAYMHVIQPKLAVSDSDKKAAWMKELKQKNARPSTSAPVVSSKPSVTQASGKQSTEDVIWASLKEAGLSNGPKV